MLRKFANLSIKTKLLLTIIPLLLSLILLRQVFLLRNINNTLSNELESRLNQSNELIYNLVDETFTGSLRNYLRGMIDDAVFSFEAVFKAYLRGSIPFETAMKNLSQGLSNRVVGDSGYFFVMDNQGKIIYHPFEEYIGADFSSLDFIAEQLKVREGYREYVWQNPDEDAPSEKAMYTKSFDTMNWIIGIAAYKEEFPDIIDFEHMGEGLFNKGSGADSFFILNADGEVLLHPTLAGQNIADIGRFRGMMKIFSDYRDDKVLSGSMDLGIADPDTGKNTRFRLSYSWIPVFDWVIVSAMSIDDFYKPLRDLNFIFIFFDFLLLLLVAGSLSILFSFVLKPLKDFTSDLLEQEEFRNKHFRGKGDEVAIASEVFQLYAEQIKSDKIKLKEAVEENRLLADFPYQVKQPVIRFNKDYICNFMNKQAQKELYPLHTGQDILTFLDVESIESLSETDRKPLEKQILGRLYEIRSTSIPQHNDCYLHFYDVTTKRRLSTLQSVWHHVFDTSIEGITITDEKGNVERINRSFTLITGFEEKDILGKSVNMLKSHRQDEKFYKDMWNSLIETGHWEGKIWNRKSNGEIYLEWLSISGFIDNRTGLQKYMAIFHDISEMYEKEQELEFMYTHDILTKLPSRGLFYDRLTQMVSSSKRTQETCAVIILDLHKFSRINEYIGMTGGDTVLVEMSKKLKVTLRQEDTIARLGADHFGLLLPRLNSNEQIIDIITRLQENLSESISAGGKIVKPVLNLGISLYPNDGETAEVLISKANIALEKTKKQKPGHFNFFDSTTQSELSSWAEYEESLKMALEKGEFVLHYQPKVSFESGDLDGFEALIRWNRGEGGFISPGWFIPKLEENGMIVDVGYWIIEEVCAFINKMSAKFSRDFKVGINISAKQFINSTFLSDVFSITESNRIDPRLVDLEITENIAATEVTKAIETIQRLRERGFSISIDDFGTGYSSLKYLKELQFTTLKIDKSFVDPLPGDDKSLSIVRSIIDLAKNLDKKIVVEGVETEDQARLFKELQCDILQGYYFSKPLSEEDALQLAGEMDKQIKPIV
ncbi:EAL domain-containing protein [Spirochaeta isovalerica]|uniref:Diguanylate cyclase (GGDEF)-like protein/PAS domain S-box-containing protein n=1 Tax=Spirochaeta isovalerica TaxID=150 RepID=A0A841R886_9SPIO|nr:EAL domain-containing protein [Spirochaeta isovalerica]MBB6481494.1 diguanylate cyclase (GGDEF)-like protein/PAS domain S-box-containing protein [Spirochaeta isovalerica]